MNHPQMSAYLGRMRWFAGKGRDYEVTDVERVATLPGDPLLTVDLLDVTYEGGDVERYQMPLVHLPEERADLAHALLGRHEGAWSYDAVHDAGAMRRYLQVFAGTAAEGSTRVGGAAFHRTVAAELDWEAPSRVFTGEQSNTTVVFGDETLLKLFRRTTRGRNPDIEIHRALTHAGNPAVAPLFGWVQAGTGEDAEDLAMLQAFLPGAEDGWGLALASAREDGDFSSEAEALGVAVGEVHRALAAEFGSGEVSGAELAGRMRLRLESALFGLPELAPYADGLRRNLDGLAELGDDDDPRPTLVQRVHGDLHLGQTLRTPEGWKIVDFEGEPAKSLEERRRPDSPFRDVAGMLRSFDYAALTVVKEGAVADSSGWLARCREAFRDGYDRTSTGSGGHEATLLVDAYEADKAVYEVGYEARNRPGWVDIPLTAIERIAAHAHAATDDGAPA
jgi:maltokinase